MSDQMLNPNEIQKIDQEQNMPMEPDIFEDQFAPVDQFQIDQLKGKLTGPAVSLEEMGDAYDLEEMISKKEAHTNKLIKDKAEKEKKIRQNDTQRNEVLEAIVKNDAVINFPPKTKLSGEFKESFRSKVSDNARAKKQRNKRSRLFQKARNKEKFNDIENAVTDDNMEALESLLGPDQDLCEKEELADLSAFMQKGVAVSQTILNLYLGKGDYKQGMDRIKAMDNMLAMLSDFNLGRLDLTNDKVLADHAKELETLSLRLCAFESLAAKNGYFANMNDETEKKISEKLKTLHSVVTYYTYRKEVINDPLYASHYNEELSMDVTAAETPEQKALAEKLLRAHLAGVEMMKQNGASNMLVVRQFEPAYKNGSEGRNLENNIKTDLRADLVFESQYYRYQHGNKPVDKADKLRLQNERMAKKLRDRAITNMEHFEGNMEWQEGYEKTPYDPEKVMEYVKELKSIKLSDIKFGSYRELIDHFPENFKLCDRVAHLHSEIVKAILYGYEDENFTDDDIMELRAISMSFVSVKNTLCAVNQALVKDEKTAKFSDKEWDAYIKKFVVYNAKGSIPMIRALSDNMDSLLEECKEKVNGEEAEKEESIKTAYRVVLGTKEAPDISEEELKERKKAYQRNAFVQDRMADNSTVVSGVGSPSTSYLYYLEKKHGKRFGLGRMANLYLMGKPAAEVERLYKLSTGSPKEQLTFYLDLLKQYANVDLDIFDGTNLGKFYENWTELLQFSNTADGEMKNLVDKIRKVLAMDESLKLPEEYASTAELDEQCMVLYDMGQVMTTKTEGIMQLRSTKWLHAFSMKELGSIDQNQNAKIKENLKALTLGEFPFTYESDEYTTFSKLLASLGVINGENPLKPGERISFDTDKKALYAHFKEEYKKKAEESKKRSEDAAKKSEKNSLIPVVSQQECEEKKAAGDGSVMSEEQWKTYGGATREKIVTKEEAGRLSQKSQRFLTSKKIKGNTGQVILKPSLPVNFSVNDKWVDLRTPYNMLIKSYMRLVTNEDGSFKKGVEKNGGICDKFDFLTAGVGLYKNEENIAKAKEYLEEAFKPEIRQILEEESIFPHFSEKEKEECRKKAVIQAQEMCDKILEILKNVDGPLIPDEISLPNHIKLCSNLMDTKEEKLKEIASGFKFKESKMENGQEVIVERSATEEEISAAIAEMKEDVKIAYADMKEVRNLKTHKEEIPIPNTCSANAHFMGNLKKMVTGKKQPFINHRYNTYVMEHPEEVRVFLRKNLHLLQLAGGQSDKSIEMYKKNLDRMSFPKDKVYTDKDLDDDVRDLMEIANKLQKFSYHVAPRVVDDEEEGLITVEGMAAATDQYMVSPFTMNAIIGQYKGKKELIEEGKAYEHEGFSKFNNAIPPYSTTVKDALKCRMKDFLSYASTQELQ